MLRACNIAGLLSAATLFAIPLCAQHYFLKLNALVTPESQGQGLFLKARIDGGPELRMLLDSGAQHVVLDKRAAARIGKSAGATLELVGLGASAKTCRRVAPGTVQIGELILKDCEMVVLDNHLIDGIDGIIPLSLFADYLVRLDLPHRVLELDTYHAGPTSTDSGYLAARADQNLLFLRTTVNESHAGYVLLDTGATYNAVSPEAARASRTYWNLKDAIELRSGAGATEGFMLPVGLRFRVGPQVFSADPAVVLDLSDFAHHHDFEIAGILGYPALRYSIVTVNYRDSLVRIEGK
jgi:predicted aspartyl protease